MGTAVGMTEHTDIPMSIPDGLQDVRKGSGRNRVTLDNRRGKKTLLGSQWDILLRENQEEMRVGNRNRDDPPAVLVTEARGPPCGRMVRPAATAR